MADPAIPAPAKPRSPLRWVLLGCGILTGLFVLSMGGCAGIFYFIYKGTAPVAEVGAVYLRQAPALEAAVGAPLTVQRDWSGWNVQVTNDTGTASITYTVSGPKSSGKSTVWLTKANGKWTPEGARFSPAGGSGGDVDMGSVPKGHSFRKDWD